MLVKSLPAERWRDLARINSAQATSLSRSTANPPRLPTMVLDGYHHIVAGVSYGSWGALIRPRADAWRLVPLAMFDGTVYRKAHDDAAIRRGERERGDLKGFLVRIAGAEEVLVCDRKVPVEMGLPDHILGLDAARKWNAAASATGWRVIHCKRGLAPRWASLGGHPVVIYEGLDGRENRALIWRMPGGKLDELRIADDVSLDDPSDAQIVEAGTQLSLI
jgi:hypothetical protein